MALIKFEPFDDIEKFFPGFDDAFALPQGGFAPLMDVYQTKDAVVVETPLPGVDPGKVNISIENDVLTIDGNSEKTSEVEEKNYYRKEVRSGHFFRQVHLPSHVQGAKASAISENGVLKITVPKASEKKTTTIKVQVKNKK